MVWTIPLLPCHIRVSPDPSNYPVSRGEVVGAKIVHVLTLIVTNRRH